MRIPLSAPTPDGSRGAVLAALDRSGVLGAWLPPRNRGAESTVRGVAAALTALGRDDADLGWIGAVAAVTNLAVAELPEETRREIRGDGPDPLVCGTLAPSGVGTWIDDAFHVRALSTPASGLPWASWVMATVLDEATGAPIRVFVPVAGVRVETTWDADGLRGSGGDTAHLDGVVVPASRTRLLAPAPGTAPLTFFASVFFGAPLIGVVEAALDRVLREAADGGARWRRPDVRSALSTAARRVARARALHTGATAGLGTRSEVDAVSPTDRATVAHLAVRAVTTAEAALPLLVSASGAAALHAEHPLARAVRDVGVGARHTALSPTKAAIAHEAALVEGLR